VVKKTWVINHPRGIRDANEKLFGLRFAKWSPPTVVTSSIEEILSFQKKIRSDLVVKPLYEKGGKGVFLLKREARSARAFIRKATRQEKEIVIAQKFLPLPSARGDKRILLWKDEILGVFGRIPPPGDFRSNLSLGGKFIRCSLSAREKRLTREVSRELIRRGLFWVGLDVREGWLIEVNVTSPAGLVELDQLYGGATENLAQQILRLTVP
jgi:glutathione synthase